MVGLVAGGVCVLVCEPAEHTSSIWRPGDEADVVPLGVGDELALVLAVEQVVAGLHADELVPVFLFGDRLQLDELCCQHG